LENPHPSVRLRNGTTKAYVHADQLNSVRTVTDGTETLGKASVYRPFGEIRDWNVDPVLCVRFTGCGVVIGWVSRRPARQFYGKIARHGGDVFRVHRIIGRDTSVGDPARVQKLGNTIRLCSKIHVARAR